MYKKINIYTDGACKGNPGPGGAAAILIYNNIEKEISFGFKNTTNNRMELRAVIFALSELKEKCDCTIYSDSKYVCDGITSWIKNWKKNGWMSKKNPVKNKDLWIKLDNLCKKHIINFVWIKAHNNNIYNDRVDFLAVKKSNENINNLLEDTVEI